MPEVVEGHRLRSLSRKEDLFTAWENNLASVHIGHLIKAKEKRYITQNVPHLFLALEHFILEADIVVIKRS